MGDPTTRSTSPHLRLVVDNDRARADLMPMLDVERRLRAVERELRRVGLPGEARATLLEMRRLLRCELEARPFNPMLARRCEHRLRWVERNLTRTPAYRPASLFGRALAALGAILPPPLASA